jgi:hypothetical protein
MMAVAIRKIYCKLKRMNIKKTYFMWLLVLVAGVIVERWWWSLVMMMMINI